MNSKSKYFFGIDPGKNGGIGWLNDDGEYGAFKMPQTGKDMSDLFLEISKLHIVFLMLEKVAPRPQLNQFGQKVQGIKSTWTFAEFYYRPRQCLDCYGISYDLVSPNKWMTKLNCKTGGDKNITKAKAQQIFPKLKITHAIADSMLLAYYAKTTFN